MNDIFYMHSISERPHTLTTNAMHNHLLYSHIHINLQTDIYAFRVHLNTRIRRSEMNIYVYIRIVLYVG